LIIDAVEEYENLTGQAFVTTKTIQGPTAELYDSGCANHISPYRNQFENFEKIAPRLFKAANQQTFSAVGKGDLVVNVPDGNTYTKLRLQDVLYSSNVGYTLVSIRRLNEAGFTALFGHGKCVIRGPDDERIGEISRTGRKIYKVEHEEDVVNAVEETLTLDKLHRQMDHISIQTARDLIKQNMVTGLRLEYSSTGKPFFCESCVYAKAT